RHLRALGSRGTNPCAKGFETHLAREVLVHVVLCEELPMHALDEPPPACHALRQVRLCAKVLRSTIQARLCSARGQGESPALPGVAQQLEGASAHHVTQAAQTHPLGPAAQGGSPLSAHAKARCEQI